MPKVVLNTYPVAFECPGGGEVQLLRTREGLERQGWEVILHDPWNPKLKAADVVHQFSVQGGIYNFGAYVQSNRIPFAISSILWPSGDLSQYPMGEIRGMLDWANIVFPNSHAEAELLARVFNLPIEKFHPVVNGIDELFHQSVGPDLFRSHFEIERPFLLCVGNIEARKNQKLIAEALERLPHDVLLIGHIRDQRYFGEMMALAESKAPGKVRYLGSLDHKSELLRSAYEACEVFLLPSTLETPGLAALEAGAMGARIAITEVGATQEYFGDQVSYVKPESPESLIQAVEKELARTRDSVLKNQVRSKYTWDEAARQTIEGYRKICKKGL